MIFICPYCKNTKKHNRTKFKSWDSVRAHTGKCRKNNHIYYVCKVYGPIHYKEFLRSSIEIRTKYPNISGQLKDILKQFRKHNIPIPVKIGDGFGEPTLAKDNVMYRSIAEATFVDKFLVDQYTYKIEPQYPNLNKFFDWYICELDLYIELDGHCNKERTQKKLLLLQNIDVNCAYIPIEIINNYNTLLNLLTDKSVIITPQ